MPGPAEFDHYSPAYDAGMDDPLKRAAGADARAFLLPKLALLRRDVARRWPQPGTALRHLDFGCGSADFLQLAATEKTGWQSEGCDISTGMLDEARHRWPHLASHTPLWTIGNREFPVQAYDFITAICVFHHIPPAEWVENLKRLRAALRPGGRFYLFEHNPWNPVTRYIVRRAKIDQNAILLSPTTARHVFAQAGLAVAHCRHFLFVPPRWKTIAHGERLISSLPLGGQYCLTGQLAQP